MVKYWCIAVVKWTWPLLLVSGAIAQTDADRERRLHEVERKIQQLDPTYVIRATSTFDERLAALEQRLDQLVASRVNSAGGQERQGSDTTPGRG